MKQAVLPLPPVRGNKLCTARPGHVSYHGHPMCSGQASSRFSRQLFFDGRLGASWTNEQGVCDGYTLAQISPAYRIFQHYEEFPKGIIMANFNAADPAILCNFVGSMMTLPQR